MYHFLYATDITIFCCYFCTVETRAYTFDADSDTELNQ